MKTSKRSLITAIAILCVCALSLSAASYAWFTNSTQAKVDTLTMKVEQRSSLELSITGAESSVGWKTTLSTDDFVTANLYYNGAATMALNDASTNDFTSWVKANYDEENLNFDFTANAAVGANNTPAADYLKMPISFRAPTAGSVKLSDTSFAVVLDDLAPAMRVGLDIDGNKKIYGDPSAAGFLYQNVGEDKQNFEDTAIVTTATDALSKLATDFVVELTENTQTGYYEGEAIFYLWIEGTDAACIDKNTPSDVTAGMSFELVEAGA